MMTDRPGSNSADPYSLGDPCKTILVVEDDAGIRETLSYALELEGYRVVSASNGREGIAALERVHNPCMILLDLMMPVLNGWQFVEAISKVQSYARIPIVILTAFADTAKSIRADAIIPKPIDLDTLLRAVHDWCGEPNRGTP